MRVLAVKLWSLGSNVYFCLPILLAYFMYMNEIITAKDFRVLEEKILYKLKLLLKKIEKIPSSDT